MSHSADHLEASERDFWWNRDFIALMAKRCDFARVTSVLDVGCGVGHWLRTLLTELPGVRACGVEPEGEWVARARAVFGDRATIEQGSVEALPFADASFDLVTCQTVLIHVRDVPAALREMLRVCKPGGTLLLAEPSNAGSALLRDGAPIALADRIALARLQAICEAGKEALGEGFDSFGDLLPGLVARLASDVRVYQADRPTTLFPPYAGAAQQAAVADLLDRASRDLWLWGRADTRRYFLAGGGAETDFEGEWARALAAVRAVAAAVDAKTFHTAGGLLHYLVVATKMPA